MTQAILHIGHHKTGSSSIQSYLGSIDQNTIDINFRYLSVLSKNHCSIVTAAFGKKENKKSYKRIKFGNGLRLNKFEKDEARNIISEGVYKAKAQERNLIISAEDLCILHFDEIVDVRDFLIESGITSFKIIGYVRDIQSWANSYSQQIIRHSGETLEKVIKEVPYPMYREYFEKFFTIFGAENVVLRPFDDKSFIDGCLIRDFLTFTDSTIPNGKIFTQTVGESLSADQVHLASFINKIYRKKGWKNRRMLTRLFSKVGTEREFKKFALPTDILEKSILKSASDLEWIIGVTDIDRDFLSRTATSEPNFNFNQTINRLDLAELVMLAGNKKKPPKSGLKRT